MTPARTTARAEARAYVPIRGARAKGRAYAGFILICTVLAAAACNSQPGGQGSGGTTRLSIATGGTGGVYYPYGGGIAKVISENLPNVQATAEVTAASVDNLKFLQDGRSDIAFTMTDTLEDAAKGQGPFKDSGAVPARSLATLYSNYLHLVTLEDTGIRKIADLKGSA